METGSYLITNKEFPSTVSLLVKEEEAGQRLDKFLSDTLSHYSRSFFQGLVAQQAILINGSAAKASTLVKTGDTILITFPEEPKQPLFTPVNNNLGIEILYTHDHFLIINKPAHLLVHQTEIPTTDPTIIDWLLTNYQEISPIGDASRPGIVHRLDRETSGLLIIARTNFAHRTFSDLFKNRHIKKSYLAIVEGHPPASGTIDFSIGRHPAHRKKMMAYPSEQQALTSEHRQPRQPNVRHALSHYTVLTYFEHHALVEVYPVTGRTHQIRVHCAAIGHPLVGDFLYGTPSKLINRHALHASTLTFTFQDESHIFSAELPADFKRLIASLEQ